MSQKQKVMQSKNDFKLPKQIIGSAHDTESFKKIEEAITISSQYDILKDRFFDINNWMEYCGSLSAEFKLCNSCGIIINSKPKLKDFIRIKIPGPGLHEGNNYDWVQIIRIEEGIHSLSDYCLFECSPCKMPGAKHHFGVAHFYTSKATSTFIISKENDCLKVSVHGRNETPNYKVSALSKLRNFMIAVGGMFGFSKIEWKCLTGGLLDFK